jgi:hypothetical protein
VSKTAEISDVSAPRWMTKAEKRQFEVLKLARKAAGNPVSAADLDLLSDYVSSRTRIAVLRRFLKKQVADGADYAPSQSHINSIVGQLDRTTSLSRRLARELGLSTET